MHKQIFIFLVEEKSKFKSQNILSDSTKYKRIGQIVFIKNSIHLREIGAFNHLNYLVIRLMSITKNHVLTIQITSVTNKVSSKNLHIIFKIINTGRKSMIGNLNQTC